LDKPNLINMDNWENEIDSKDEVDMDLLNELRNGEFKIKDFCRLLPNKNKLFSNFKQHSNRNELANTVSDWANDGSTILVWENVFATMNSIKGYPIDTTLDLVNVNADTPK
jgi:hypothetical protein